MLDRQLASEALTDDMLAAVGTSARSLLPHRQSLPSASLPLFDCFWSAESA